MKTLVVVLLLFASTSLHAQPFFIDHEPETMMGIFDTFLENDAYQKIKLLPRGSGPGITVTAESPPQVRFPTPEQGWDIVVFDDVEHQTRAYHSDFSAGLEDLGWEKKVALLERLKAYSP